MTEKTELLEQAVVDAAIESLDRIESYQKDYPFSDDSVPRFIMAVKAYQKSIEPKTDWSKVPKLTEIKHRSFAGIGLFMGDVPDAYTPQIMVFYEDRLHYWLKDKCTPIEPTYTEPVWHPWTGERPDWVKGSDRVLYRNAKGYIYALHDQTAVEFMVIKGGQD